MPSIIQLISLIIALSAFYYTFYAAGKLVTFLSPVSKIPVAQTWIIYLLDNKSKLQTALYAITFDSLWIVAFILQHSLMKTPLWKRIIHGIGFALAERSIYCLASAYALLSLIRNWKPAPTIVAWQFDVNHYSVLWWTITLTHVIAWIVIYGGSIIMDLPELIGLKQVYYEIKDLAPPLSYKTYALRHLHSKYRHPSFIGFILILWTTNCMTLDRLVLAIMLTFYMYTAWSPDQNDVTYVKVQLQRKRQELKELEYY